MRQCKVCLSALRQTLLERRLMRKRYTANMNFFRAEIGRLDTEIGILIKKARKHG